MLASSAIAQDWLKEMEKRADLREKLRDLRETAHKLVKAIEELESLAVGYEEATKELVATEKRLEQSRVTLLRTAEDQLESLRALRISKRKERKG